MYTRERFFAELITQIRQSILEVRGQSVDTLPDMPGLYQALSQGLIGLYHKPQIKARGVSGRETGRQAWTYVPGAIRVGVP